MRPPAGASAVTSPWGLNRRQACGPRRHKLDRAPQTRGPRNRAPALDLHQPDLLLTKLTLGLACKKPCRPTRTGSRRPRRPTRKKDPKLIIHYTRTSSPRGTGIRSKIEGRSLKSCRPTLADRPALELRLGGSPRRLAPPRALKVASPDGLLRLSNPHAHCSAMLAASPDRSRPVPEPTPTALRGSPLAGCPSPPPLNCAVHHKGRPACGGWLPPKSHYALIDFLIPKKTSPSKKRTAQLGAATI